MIQKFVGRFMAEEAAIRAELTAAHPEGYDAMVTRVVKAVGKPDEYEEPSVDRITTIDHGNYQGTRLYIVGAGGYQPSDYWSIFVDYGSCSGCDTYEATRRYSDDPPTEQQVDDYWSMMLHMVQSMRKVGKGSGDADD